MDDIIRYAVIQFIMQPSIDIFAFNCCLHTHAYTHNTHTHTHLYTVIYTQHTHSAYGMYYLKWSIGGCGRAPWYHARFFTALDLGSSEKSMESSW